MNKEIFNRKYAEFYDLFNSQKDYESESSFLKEVFKKYCGDKIKTILDLGCGTGVNAGIIASNGYDVTGIDISQDMIEIAKSKKIQDTKFIVGDMSNFKLNKKFDVIICMFSALGYLTKNEEIESFFKSVRNHLNQKGLLVIDCWNGLGVIRELPVVREKNVEIKDVRVIRTSYPKLDSLNHLCDIKFLVKIFEKNYLKEEYNEQHKVRFFFPQEMRKYLKDAGFEILDICVPYKLGTKVDENVWNMIFISKL